MNRNLFAALYLTLTPALFAGLNPVPEPSTVVLLGAGAVALVVANQVRNRKKK